MRATAAEIHAMITDRMIKALNEGTVPWHKSWRTETGGAPKSASTGKPYRGVNRWLLSLTQMEMGYASPYWFTFHKAHELGGHVIRGSKSTKVVYWELKVRPNPDDPDNPIKYWFGKTDSVFNGDQIEGLPDRYYPAREELPEVPTLPEPQAILDEYIARGPKLRHVHQDRAYYQSEPDMITLPEREQFDNSEAYYATAYHEAGHSTGNPKRLNRKAVAQFDHFGSEKYSREELCAEMTSVMLCEITGIDGQFDSSASYIASWLKQLKNDTKLVSQAATQAQAAVDLITGETADSQKSEPQRELVNA